MEFAQLNKKIANAKHLRSKKDEIEKMTDKDILDTMKQLKTQLSPLYAKRITKNKNTNKTIPELIKKLFKIIDN